MISPKPENHVFFEFLAKNKMTESGWQILVSQALRLGKPQQYFELTIHVPSDYETRIETYLYCWPYADSRTVREIAMKVAADRHLLLSSDK